MRIRRWTFASLLLTVLLGACTPSEQGEQLAPPTPEASLSIRETGLVADVYRPANPTAAPAVLVIGGSEGGLDGSGRIAKRLAEEGFVAMAVAYFGLPGLPEQLISIPLERFDHAIERLKSLDGVRDQRIAIVGVSKGAEAALLVASARTDLAAVLAATPSSVAWQGLDMVAFTDIPSWTRKGQALPYVRYNHEGEMWPLVRMYERSLRDASEAAAIPVERIQAPLLLISGEEDQLWPASRMAAAMVERIKTARPEAQVVHLQYADAGHAIFGRPLAADDPRAAQLAELGGSIEGNLAARRDGWPRALAFLRQAN